MVCWSVKRARPRTGFPARTLAIAAWLFCVCLLREGEAQTYATKPPVGAVLSPQHPLANGLIVCPLINEGAGQSLLDSGTKQSFIMDNPLVWVNLPGTAQYPWVGPALRFNGTPGPTMGPGCRIPVGSIPFFQTEPNGATGLTVAYLWSPNTGVAQSARRIGDTDQTAVYTIYESIAAQANKWTYTYRNAANVVQLRHFAYVTGDWVFSVVCIKEGECKIYMNGVLVSTSTDLNFHSSWSRGTTNPPIWWHMTEGSFFYPSQSNVVFGGDLAGAWIWSRYLTQADVTSLYNSPWGMFSGPPSVITNPVHRTGTSGATVNFTAAATANLTPTVQWQVSTTGIAGTFSNMDSIANPTAATVTLTLTNITPAQNGNAYRAVFTNSAGSTTTTAATLTVYSLPVLTLPANITVPATGKTGATVIYSATANDAVDGALTPVCAPPSGSTFPIGVTTVTGAATNAGGLTATGSFTVTVQRTYAWFQDQYGLINADPTADPYHTGVGNLAAYAFGVNPSAPDRSQLPKVGWQGGFLQISYPRWKDTGDLTYVVEVSGDLQNWNFGTNYTQLISVTPIDGTREQVVERDLIPITGAPRRFIHVRNTH